MCIYYLPKTTWYLKPYLLAKDVIRFLNKMSSFSAEWPQEYGQDQLIVETIIIKLRSTIITNCPNHRFSTWDTISQKVMSHPLLLLLLQFHLNPIWVNNINYRYGIEFAFAFLLIGNSIKIIQKRKEANSSLLLHISRLLTSHHLNTGTQDNSQWIADSALRVV